MKDHRKPHIRADPLEETRRWGYSIVINYNLRLLVLSSKQIYTNTSIPPFYEINNNGRYFEVFYGAIIGGFIRVTTPAWYCGGRLERYAHNRT